MIELLGRITNGVVKTITTDIAESLIDEISKYSETLIDLFIGMAGSITYSKNMNCRRSHYMVFVIFMLVCCLNPVKV